MRREGQRAARARRRARARDAAERRLDREQVDWGELLDELNAAEADFEEVDLNGCNDWTCEP